MTSLIKSIERNWSHRGLAFYSDSNMYRLLSVLSTEGERTMDEAQDIQQAYHIRTAEGKQLDKFGYAVKLPRQAGEPDERYRLRIQLQYRLNSVEGTMDEIIQFIGIMMDLDPSNITFENRFDDSPSTLYITAQEAVWDQSPLSRQEIVDFASQLVSAGHSIFIEQPGTFELIDDATLADTGHDPEKGLTSDNMQVGGQLAGDIN